MATPKPLSDFTRLNPQTYLYSPSSITTPDNTRDPCLILLITWLNAIPRHIQKYTSGYRTLFPSSTILLLTTSTKDITISSNTSNHKRLAPTLSYLYHLNPANNPSDPKAKILLHLFSNGGASTTFLLLKSYLAETGRPLQMEKMVFDSSPGEATYALSVRALSVSLPKNLLLYILGSVLIRVFLAAWFVVDIVIGRENVIEAARRGLNDPGLTGEGVGRLYVYGVADEMVRWQDVEEHASEAEGRGFGVMKERFDGTGHVGHAIGDGGRYWGAVKRLWES